MSYHIQFAKYSWYLKYSQHTVGNPHGGINNEALTKTEISNFQDIVMKEDSKATTAYGNAGRKVSWVQSIGSYLQIDMFLPVL